jgi:hypothetical protein
MPEPAPHSSTSDLPMLPSANPDMAALPTKKRRSKGRKRRAARRHSFIAEDDRPLSPGNEDRESPDDDHANLRDSFYRLGMGNVSGESLESEALLDHR